MIIAGGRGRAGNLMFQLGGIESVLRRSGERVVVFNFSPLEEIFPTLNKHVTVTELPPWLQRVFPWVDSALRRLAHWRVIGSIVGVHTGPEIVRRRGLVPLAYFWGGFCQGESLVSTKLLWKLFTENILAESHLRAALLGPSHSTTTARCFVHVRREDFLRFPYPETPAALPLQWFLSQMEKVKAQFDQVAFLVLSDDPEWAQCHLGHIANTEILELTARESFAVMSTSDAGILSPSTFSWWAAYFATKDSRGPFIAPKLWTGWRLGKWDPHEKIEASFLTYVEVDPSV